MSTEKVILDFKEILKDLYIEAWTEVKFAKVRSDAIIPTKDIENAGADIYACFDEEFKIIPPHTTKLIPTGIACALETGYYFQVEERGSTGSKGIKKSAGVIDSGYRGEIFVALTNTNDQPVAIVKEHSVNNLADDTIIYPYTKAIAQLVLHRLPLYETQEITYEELRKIPSKRGTGMLGSSGK